MTAVRWRQWKAFTLQNLNGEITFFFPLETVLKPPPARGTRERHSCLPRPTSCPGKSKDKHVTAVQHKCPQLQTMFPCLAPARPTQPGLMQTALAECISSALQQVLPALHACSWTRMDRQKGGWTQRAGKREFRTSVFIYKWEFWPSSGK